ncbi:MAG: DUF3800 domain-containing protein [Steroidobacteraceae bacterium]
MAEKDPSAEELEGCRDHRLTRQRLERQQALVLNLRAAHRLRVNTGLDSSLTGKALQQSEDELAELQKLAFGRIEHRKKPKINSSETCSIYIDECGTHSLTAKDDFKAFCLAAVIVRDADVDVFDASWKRWKLKYLGSESRKVHEPDVRKKTGSFWFNRDTAKQKETIDALSTILDELEYVSIVCVLHRDKYIEQHGDTAMDESLPHHGYLMSLHFMAERLALALQTQFGGAKGRLTFEARGPREDAELQYEFARLFLDGTSYLAPDYFRRQFLPGLRFKAKKDNVPGLEIADLIARPCGEKVLNPESTPERWEQARTKLCQGSETKHSILGLKVTPWSDTYIDLWKS